MSNFSIYDFKDRSGRIWFNPDKFEASFSSLEATLEPLTCEFSQSGNSGSVSASLQPLSCVLTSYSLNGTLTGSFQPLTFQSVGTLAVSGQINGSLENHTYSSVGTVIENWVDATFEYHILEGIANMGLDASLELHGCSMQSMFGASVTGTLETLDLLVDGNSTFVSFAPLLSKLNISMHTGASVQLTTERRLFSSQGNNEILASMKGSLEILTFSSRSGVEVQAVFEKLGFLGSARTPILGTLNIQTENYLCSMLATSESVNSLVASLRSLALNSDATQVNPGDSPSLHAILKAHNATLTGSNGQVATLDAHLSLFIAEFIGLEPALNDLTAYNEYLNLKMTGQSSSSLVMAPVSCTPYKTMTFEAE